MIAVAPVESGHHLAFGRDLSLGGIRFQIVGVEIELGDVLRIYVSVEDQTIEALGRVVWATTLDTFTTDVGLEFIEIDPLAAQIFERVAAA